MSLQNELLQEAFPRKPNVPFFQISLGAVKRYYLFIICFMKKQTVAQETGLSPPPSVNKGRSRKKSTISS